MDQIKSDEQLEFVRLKNGIIWEKVNIFGLRCKYIWLENILIIAKIVDR